MLIENSPPAPYWQTGFPVAPGWYIASYDRDADARRYWNGSRWSAPCYSDDPQLYHDRARNTPAESQSGIEWSAL
jgi:hypothetical protein